MVNRQPASKAGKVGASDTCSHHAIDVAPNSARFDAAAPGLEKTARYEAPGRIAADRLML
jgi:hypothetical protein